MLQFKDLNFKKHRVIPNAVQATLELEDGSWVSIVGGAAGCGTYGNGKTSFEMMSSRTNSKNEVRGWLSIKQINDHLRYIQNNPLKTK